MMKLKVVTAKANVMSALDETRSINCDMILQNHHGLNREKIKKKHQVLVL